MELFKFLSNEQLTESAILFTEVFYNATPPEAWELARVVEIYKGKGSHSNPEMYRPISLLNTAYKLFARLIQTRMAESLDHLLRDSQFGFRANRSCTQPLFVLHRLQEM